ncbi:MAG: hypothetical protein AAGE43_17420 [Pseudomonadota bacterium]
MSIDQHRTDQVYAVVQNIVDSGHANFRPGHIADALREAGHPMLSWEIRGELAQLEADGLVTSDSTTGEYSLVDAARKAG